MFDNMDTDEVWSGNMGLKRKEEDRKGARKVPKIGAWSEGYCGIW